MCLSASQCTARDGYYVDEEGKKCVSKAECTGYLLGEDDAKRCVSETKCAQMAGHLLYKSDDGNKRLCVEKDKCKGLGYAFRIQCLTEKQCTDRGYYEVSEQDHKCVQKSSCPNDKYDLNGVCVTRL